MSGLVIVKRIDWRERTDPNKSSVPRAPISPFTWDGVLANYAGIDGEVWPAECVTAGKFPREGMASLSDSHGAIESWRCAQSRIRCDLLLCATEMPSSPLQINTGRFDFVGYDVGYEITESTLIACSLVYQDIIFGRFDALVEFGKLLNHHMLFTDPADAGAFIRTREFLLQQGYDLERIDECETFDPFRVFLFRP